MATAVLKISYFEPVILKEKPNLLRPGHIRPEICKEGSWAWLSFIPICITHKNSPLAHSILIIPA
jgi:hypothetical protein